MHAVIVSVTIRDGEQATTNLRNEIVPRVKEAPGFGPATGSGSRVDKGRGTIVFESEDAARAVADQISQQPGEAVTLDSVDVGEVVESAGHRVTSEGACRNRTGVNGFAGRCVTTPPRRQRGKRSVAIGPRR